MERVHWPTIPPREQIVFKLQLRSQGWIVIVLIGCILSSCPHTIEGSPSRSFGQMNRGVRSANNKKRIRLQEKFQLSKPLSRIRFQLYENRLIFFQVRVNGSEPLWFMLDSGGTKTLINEKRAQAL